MLRSNEKRFVLLAPFDPYLFFVLCFSLLCHCWEVNVLCLQRAQHDKHIEEVRAHHMRLKQAEKQRREAAISAAETSPRKIYPSIYLRVRILAFRSAHRCVSNVVTFMKYSCKDRSGKMRLLSNSTVSFVSGWWESWQAVACKYGSRLCWYDTSAHVSVCTVESLTICSYALGRT